MTSIALRMESAINKWFVDFKNPRYFDSSAFSSDSRALEVRSLVLECLRSKDREESAGALTLFRRAVVNAYRATESRVFFNLKLPGMEPAPMNQYYRALSYPFLAGYHVSDATASIFSMDFMAVKDVIPAEIFSYLGGEIQPENVDVFLSIDNRAPVQTESVNDEYKAGNFLLPQSPGASSELLVKFHRWFFPQISGREEGEEDLYMGAFPGLGCSRAEYNPIPMNSMGCMKVHVHDGLYSPNTAHIAIDVQMPFSSLWIAARKETRICIAKIIKNTFQSQEGSTNSQLPSLADYFSMGENCRHLDDYVKRLSSIQSVLSNDIQRLLLPLKAMSSTQQIQHVVASFPLSLQRVFFRASWNMKGSPEGIDANFGMKAFFHKEDLDSKYWLKDEEYASVIACAVKKIESAIIKDLIEDPLAMLYASSVATS